MLSQPSPRVVAPVVGQQRSSSIDLCTQYSAAAVQHAASFSPSPPLSTGANMHDVAMPAGISLGVNVATVIPGSQPLIAVGAVASDVPTLMSQLALAGATLQNTLMAGALYNSHGGLPSNLCGLSLGIPNTLVQSENSSFNGTFTSQTSDHDEHPSNV